MSQADIIASVGLVPEQSSLNQIEAAVANAVSKGSQRGTQKGLIQGINANAYVQPLGRITGKANEFEKSMAAANARVIAFGASTAPIFAMGAAFHKLVESTIEVQKVMTGINAIFGLGAGNLRTFTSQLFQVANQTGQSFNMAADAATEFARQGLNVEETLKRTSAALILNKISGLDMGEAVSSITSILNGFSKEALNSTDIINRMTSVDTQFAVSAGDLAEALKRVGASANDANVSFNQTLGLITAARQITGREGSVIGNSFKTMFTRLQRPEVLSDLEEAGIKVRDLSGKTLPLIEVLKDLAGTYNSLAASQKSFVSEAVGGVYQINILKGIMRDLSSGVSIYDNAVTAADNSTSAVTKRMEVLNSTLSSGLVRTMNDLALASSNVGNALIGNSMKNGIGFFDNMLKGTIENTNPDNKAPGAQAIQAGIKGLGNFLAGPGVQVGVNIILKLLDRLRDFSMKSGKDLLGLDAGIKERETLEQKYFEILSREKEKVDEIIAGKRTLNELISSTISASVQGGQRENLLRTMAAGAAASTVGKIPINNTSEIPNLFNPVANALYKENVLTGGNARLSYSPLLVSSNNPFGLAAIDSRTQKNATDAVMQHKILGQTTTQIKNGMSVPHLATGIDLSVLLSTFGFLAQMGHSTDNIQKFINVVPQLFSATEKEIYAKRKLVDEFDKMGKDLLTTGKPQTFYGNKFSNLQQVSQSEVVKEIEVFRQQVKEFGGKQDTDRKNIWNTGFKIANWSAFGGAALSQTLGNVSPTAGASAEVLQAGITAAGQALIAFPNKIGKALSVGLAASGVLNALDTFGKGLENQRAAADLELGRLKNVNESLQTLSQTSSNLTNLYNDAGSSVETISRETKKYSETLAALSQLSGGADMARKIALAPSSDARQGVIQDLLGQQSKRAETTASLINAQELFGKRSFFGMNHIPGLQSNEGYVYSNDYEKDSVKQQLVENASVAISNMGDDFKTALIGSVESLSQFTDILSKFNGGGAEDIRGYLGEIKSSGGSGAYNKVIQEIRSLLTEKLVLERNPQVTNLLGSSRGKLEAQQLNIDNAVKNQQYIQRLFLNQGVLGIQNVLDVRQSNVRGAYNQEMARVSGYEINSPLFAQSHGERTVAQREYGINLQKNAIETRNALTNLNIETNRNLVGSLAQNFDENLAKSAKSGNLPNITGEKNLGISENRANLITAINTGLTSVLKGNAGDIINKFTGANGQFNFQAFSKSAAQGGSNNPVIQAQVEKYLNSQQSIDILKTLNQSALKQNEILQDFKVKSVEEQQKLTAAIQEADFKRQISYLGGIQSLLDRNSLRGTMRDVQRGIYMMSNPNASAMTQSMGATTLLEALKKMNVPMDMSNPLINKAFSVGISSGASLFGSYRDKILNNVASKTGAESAETVGLSQALGINLQEAVSKMFQAEFKPEGSISTSDGGFIDSAAYLKPFDDGLIASTKSLYDFPIAIQSTINDLKNAASGIQDAKASYDTTMKQVDKQLENLMQSIQDKYKEASQSPEPGKQQNILGYVKDVLPSIISGVGMALATAFINRGGGLFKTGFNLLTGKLSKSTVTEGEQQIVNAIQSSGNGISSVLRGGGGGSYSIGGEGTSADFASASGAWKNTLASGRMRIHIPTNLPSTILSDLGQPINSGSAGELPKIFKLSSINPPKLTIPKLLRVGNLQKALDLIQNDIVKSQGEIEILTKQYQLNLEKIAQDIHLGRNTLIKINGEDVNFSGWKGIGKSNILQRLSDMGMSSDSFKENATKNILEHAKQRLNKLAAFEQNIKNINFDKISTANSANRASFFSYQQGSVIHAREQQYIEQLHNDFRGPAIANSMAEKARTPANLLRQDLLRKSIENKQFEAWKRMIANNNSGIPEYSIKGNNINDNMISVRNTSGFSQLPSRSINGISEFIKDTKGILSNTGKSMNILPTLSGVLMEQAWKGIKSSSFNNSLFNPLSLSGFKNAGILGKGIHGLGALGLAASGYQAIGDYKNAANGGSYTQATGNLANNLLGFAGPLGMVGSIGNRVISSGVNKLIDYHLQSVEGQGYGGVLDMQRKLVDAQKRWKQRDAGKNLIAANKAQELDQQGIYESLANDPTHAQGRARQVLSSIIAPVRAGFNLDRTQLSTLHGIRNAIFSKGFKGTDKDFESWIANNTGEAESKLTGYYGKTLPTYLNDRKYTDGNGQTHQRLLASSNIYPNTTVANAQQTEQNGQLSQMIDLLKELTNSSINAEGGKTLEQHVDFATLPININVNSNLKNLPQDTQNSINMVVETLKQSIKDLKDRVAKLDGTVIPAKVNS
jgi:TP901 family phage tail tape measure protein